MLRVIVAVVLTAVVQFAWGFTFFGLLNGFHHTTSAAPDEAAVAKALGDALPETGTYFLPRCPGHHASEEATKAFMDRHEQGPIIQIHYRKEGLSMAQMPTVMGIGFGHTVLNAVLAAVLLCAALPSLTTYFARVGFVFGLGVLAASATRLSDLVWMHHPLTFTLGQAVFCVVAWLLGGAVMGAIIRPAARQTVAATSHHPSIAA